jgi:hypothetical protein
LFGDGAQLERLGAISGGHPRELLRLLKLCCEFTESERFDERCVDLAAGQLASEYRRFLEPDDYLLLRAIDADPGNVSSGDRVRNLLYQLAVFEYNDGSWRRSHPVVRTLEGYRRAAAPR